MKLEEKRKLRLQEAKILANKNRIDSNWSIQKFYCIGLCKD